MTKKDTESKVTKVETKTTKRQPRKKVYERVKEASIPQELDDHFKKDNYDLRLIRFLQRGEEDYRYLSKREKEGYELVSASEIPEEFLLGLNVVNTKNRQGLVTVGDLCLMKIDTDLRQSRREFFEQETEKHINAVDVHVLEKKGFRNLGTRSKVLTREPKFQD